VSANLPRPPFPGPIADASAWRGPTMARDPSWVWRFTSEMLAEIDAALSAIRARGLAAGAFGPDDFPLPTVGPLLSGALEEVRGGCGFALLRGLPVDRYTMDELRALYWGLGCRWGRPVVQNLKGDLIARIEDLGLDVDALNVKPSQTRAEQRPHTDPADVVALLCVRRAKAGGVSRIASSTTIYNEVLAERPGDLPILHRGFQHDLRGDDASRMGVTPPIPIYRWCGGRLSCVFNASTIKDAQRKTGHAIPAEEMAAVDFIAQTARRDDIRLDMEFEPGDIQLLNNYTVLHWRTAFVDDPAAKRLLLRFWVDVPDFRPLDPALARGYITGARTGATELAAM
jgi:hypothetical protein